MLKFVPAIALLLAAGPVLAQGGATQYPPAPNASSAMPQSPNSLPAGVANYNQNSPANPYIAGQAIGGYNGNTGTTTVAPGQPASGMTVPQPTAPQRQ